MTPMQKYIWQYQRDEKFLAALDQVILPFIKGIASASLLIPAYGARNRAAQAAQAAVVAEQKATIKALSGLLEKCLSPGDHPITIGDELWFCGAANSGIRK